MAAFFSLLRKAASLFVAFTFAITSLALPPLVASANDFAETDPVVSPAAEATPKPEASTTVESSLAPEQTPAQPIQPLPQTKQQLRLKKKLEGKQLPQAKQEQFLQKLERIEKRQEKTAIRNLKKQLKNEQQAAQKQLQDEIKASTLTKPEKQALRQQFKAENQKQLETLRQLNETLKQDLETSLKAEFSGEELEVAREVAEPDVLFTLQSELPAELFAADDTRFAEQWGLQSIGIPTSTGTTPDAKVIIALIDTGVDLNHEDLVGQFWSDPDCKDDLNEPIIGGCLNGGYDFVDDDTDPSVDDGATHGTAVAGILGANTNNQTGMASASNNHVEVMVLKVAEDNLLTAENISRAIAFAINNGADIINMSFGGPTASEQMQAALTLAEANDILVTAAAGNYGLDSDTTPIYPASYALSNIISVAALDTDDTLASFSNYGKTRVDIAAPGVNILSTLPGNNYGLVSGTSFSAPMVAALLSWYVLFPEPFPSNIPSDNDQTALLPRKEDDKNLFWELVG